MLTDRMLPTLKVDNKIEEEGLTQTTEYGLNSRDLEVDNKIEEDDQTQISEYGLNSREWRKVSSSGDIEVVGYWLVAMGYVLLAISRHGHGGNNYVEKNFNTNQFPQKSQEISSSESKGQGKHQT